MLFSMPRIIQHSYNFFCSRTPKPKLWIFSSRTPKPKLLTAKLEGSGTNPRPRIRPLVTFSYFFLFLQMLVGVHWNRTTTLIPFLQAIKHFCNFIPSYWVERFAFYSNYTSYNIFLSFLTYFRTVEPLRSLREKGSRSANV